MDIFFYLIDIFILILDKKNLYYILIQFNY